tara:strand:- start:4605 stop:5153 length:549 start_codon:yes stop_codon:yes gene_type:complete
MNTDDSGLSSRTAVGLFELAKLVSAAPIAKAITRKIAFAELSSMNKSDLQNEFKEQFGNGSRSLYSIKLNSQADCADTWEALRSAKAEKICGRSYSRVHPFNSSPCLYVGSSSNLTKRLMEHVGFGAKGTYSLHLLCWASGLRGGLDIDALIYPEISQQILCAMEDQMAVESQPMFGRRGSV